MRGMIMSYLLISTCSSPTLAERESFFCGPCASVGASGASLGASWAPVSASSAVTRVAAALLSFALNDSSAIRNGSMAIISSAARIMSSRPIWNRSGSPSGNDLPRFFSMARNFFAQQTSCAEGRGTCRREEGEVVDRLTAGMLSEW
ncbi:hypothetical protein PFISCL1PPCAC_17920, partial [Pristionchus fissidentatus]